MNNYYHLNMYTLVYQNHQIPPLKHSNSVIYLGHGHTQLSVEDFTCDPKAISRYIPGYNVGPPSYVCWLINPMNTIVL
jgi:cobalamin biosynthesis Co2+ chelatase CbiK